MKVQRYELKPHEAGCLIGVKVMVNGHTLDRFYPQGARSEKLDAHEHKAQALATRVARCLRETGVEVEVKEFPYMEG